MSSSVTGPAVMPSGGSEESDLYSLKRRFAAGFDMVVFLRLRAVRAIMAGLRVQVSQVVCSLYRRDQVA